MTHIPIIYQIFQLRENFEINFLASNICNLFEKDIPNFNI